MRCSPVLYLITDRKATRGRDLAEVIARALAALPSGAAMIQLREKDLAARELVALTRRIGAIAASHDSPLLVNDRLDVALAAGASGVHVPESGLGVAEARALGGSRLLVGASTHSPAAVATAARSAADVIVYGPVWATPGKGAPVGVAGLAAAAMAVRGTPARVFALGGVTTLDRARAARHAGAAGVAVIRAVMAAADPGRAAAELYEAVADGAAAC